jgi:hypothetical protein
MIIIDDECQGRQIQTLRHFLPPPVINADQNEYVAH